MPNYAEVKVKCPYIEEPGKNGFMFDVRSKDEIRRVVDLNNPSICVTLYPTLDEYKYVVSSPMRYSTSDIQFKVGEVIHFDVNTNYLTLRVKEEVVPYINSDKMRVNLRALVNRINSKESKECGTKLISLEKLIAIDIINEEAVNFYV